jgi:hypothetical protein
MDQAKQQSQTAIPQPELFLAAHSLPTLSILPIAQSSCQANCHETHFLSAGV